MHFFGRVYTFILPGALGGLLGSWLHQWLLLGTLNGNLSPQARALDLAMMGALIGGPIGFFPALSEAWNRYPAGRALLHGFLGLILGGVGGAMALPLAEYLHVEIFHGGLLSRALSLALLGGAVGSAVSLSSTARRWRGIAGGLLGGFVAGVTLEVLWTRMGQNGDSKVLALMLIGLFIALFIALLIDVLAEAWLEGAPGTKLYGKAFQLAQCRAPFEGIIGSDSTNVLVHLHDAQKRHASISLTDAGALLRHIASSGTTTVNGHEIRQQLLRDRDVVQIGQNRFTYREKRSRAMRRSAEKTGEQHPQPRVRLVNIAGKGAPAR